MNLGKMLMRNCKFRYIKTMELFESKKAIHSSRNIEVNLVSRYEMELCFLICLQGFRVLS